MHTRDDVILALVEKIGPGLKRLKDYAAFKSAKMSFSFVSSITSSEDLSIEYLMHKNILRSTPPFCANCDRQMSTIKYNNSKIYRCSAHKSYKVSLKKNTFLENSKLSFQDFIRICYAWSTERPVFRAVEELCLDKKTIISWYQYFRDICSQILVREEYTIGGVDHIVQIDESLIAKAKHNVGRWPKQRWVFGGYDVCEKKGFIILVEDRTAETLLYYIKKFIKPGSIIHSDKWAAYNNIKDIQVEPPYQHGSVNHSKNFKDPVTGVHTNHVECYWKNCKRKFKRMGGVQTSTLDSHIDEFMWREIYASDGLVCMNNILNHISYFYIL